MPSSVKRDRYSSLEHHSPEKKPRLYYYYPPPPPHHHHRVVLNPADCDLDFDIEGNGLQGSALYEHGFAYCWSGARADVGITGGKYCFSCKIVSGQPVDMDDTPIDQRHLCRVGISRGDDKFSTYGERFDIGDTILCAVDLESEPMGSIGFAKNGKWLGTASCLVNGGEAVFPHVLLKNVVVQLQFSYEDGLVPLDGYSPWSCAFEDGKGLMGPSFSDVCNSELIMMVGLPASGKTTWAERWVKDHPEKRYILLGTNLALDQMKVPGLLRKQNYGECFDRLMDRATAIFNTLLARASRRPCNLIIDQTNVYKSARKCKLQPFANFQKIAVVAFSRPEDLKARSEKRFRETGKEVPAEAVNEMIANFVLPGSKDVPGSDEYFDQVVYIELDMTESKKRLDEMKAKLQSGISISPYSSSSPVRYSQDNVLEPHRNLTYHHPLDSPTHLCHPTSGHSNTSNLQSQTISSGRHFQDRFLSRDDLNHRRSYSGYEHRAVAVSNFYQRNSSNHTPSNETMDLSPQYTANTNYHAAPAPVERYTTSSSSLYMHTPTLSPVASIPN
ncbi:hypothetical protein M8C21_032616, partial [Ambrosia artemisiifolia]